MWLTGSEEIPRIFQQLVVLQSFVDLSLPRRALGIIPNVAFLLLLEESGRLGLHCGPIGEHTQNARVHIADFGFSTVRFLGSCVGDSRTDPSLGCVLIS